MANKKFSEFTLKTDPANVDFVVGYDGTDNVRIDPANLAPAAPVTSVNSLTGAVSLGLTDLDDVGSDGTNGQVLTTNGSGSFTFQDAGGGGGGGGASSLNGLSDCLVDTDSLYVGEVPAGLSGNPQANTILGIDAGNSLTTGDDNTFIGNKAGMLSTSGGNNTFIGEGAGEDNTTSPNNVYVGMRCGGNATNRSNTAMGWSAFRNGDGQYNVAIGSSAGIGTNSGDFNTMIGGSTGAGTGDNNTLLGNAATRSSTSVSNEITLGNSSITSLRCAVTSITSLSDERDKSEIKDLEYGLAFIDALQPREFVWDNRPETRTEFDEEGNETEVEFYSDNKGKKDFGFIAQEVRELDNDTLRLVYTENEDKLELSYGKLVPILVKAIQELKEEVELLKG